MPTEFKPTPMMGPIAWDRYNRKCDERDARNTRLRIEEQTNHDPGDEDRSER